MLSIQKLINEAIHEKREKKEIKNWYASGLGSCMTGRYLERLGVEPDTQFDDRTLRVFSCGRLFEDWIVELIKKQENVKVETQVRIEDDNLHITGYADVVLEHDGKKLLYEIKSKNSRAFFYMEKQKEGANYQHKMQTWAYLYKTGIEEGRILYVEKDALCTLEYPVYLNDEKLKNDVLTELEILNKSWEAKLPPPPIIDKKDWRYTYCRWHKKCLSQERHLSI